MHAAHLVPELALARVVTAGGPYRPGDDLSLAFTTPSVSRLVAHDAELRAKCVPLERALVPETIAVVITHCAAPYTSGDILTLSFVDPRVARIHESRERQAGVVVPDPGRGATRLGHASEAQPAEGVAQSPIAQAKSAHPADGEERTADPASASIPEHPAPIERSHEREETSLPARANAIAEIPTGERFAESPAERSVTPSTNVAFERPAIESDLGVSYSSNGAVPVPIHAGEPMTLEANGRFRRDATHDAIARDANEHDASTYDGEATNRNGVGGVASEREASPHTRAPANGSVVVRLAWTSERLRRFVQVVDKLFTIDRLGWYRHSLAMRLLIPGEIACGDTLADVEAMRHLQALRTAAVESLGKPLLAACMPGFSITSEWLESMESSREARAIAGLRDALLPYANDGEEASERPSGDEPYTIGTISRSELVAEHATSVEAFLPLLIATNAHDAALGARLAEYRRLLIELFAQTARAGEPVRLQQMAQPNHSLDDRLWQLVGAAAEAFGGFAHA